MRDYAQALAQAEAQGLRRRLRKAEDLCHWPRITLDGVPALDLCGNDYLGLAQDARLKQAAAAAALRDGVGARASRLVGGSDAATRALENAVAQFVGAPAALVFSSGYQANVAILQALLEPGDWAFCDRLNHASLNDGVRLSGARFKRYDHLNPDHLHTLLQAAPPEANKWVVTDTIFSMDGDFPDLRALCELAARYNARVMIDEAHANGLFGEARRSGLAEAQGISEEAIAIHMGAFSKALGGAGGFAAGSQTLIDSLIQRARGFIYSTALPPSVIAAAHAGLCIIQEDREPLMRLQSLQAWFTPRLSQTLQPYSLRCDSQTQILPIVLGNQAMAVSQELLKRGYYVQAIRPPTVPVGGERLRLCLSAAHTRDDLEGFLQALDETLAQSRLQAHA
ncbi:MAG: 8-amino-7-oxononanoate synthase [Vampirovibrionales bacterium]|nr:8-amino-7-oxononanoate synthase [Vampirovibrionales bacterium]